MPLIHHPCESCQYWRASQRRCDDPEEYVDIDGEPMCRYNPGARPKQLNDSASLKYERLLDDYEAM